LARVDRDLRAEGPIPVSAEIRIMLSQIEHVATLPTIRLGIKLILLSMVQERIAGRGLG
jgi:hypothetical protein